MEQLKHMKETLTSCVGAQIAGHMDTVEASELGAAIDMIKDLSEAIYYCTITEAMEEKEEEGEKKGQHGMMYYNERMTPIKNYPMEYYDPRYRERYVPGSMYAQNGNGGSRGGSNGGNNARGGGSRGYHDGMIPMDYYPMYDDGTMYNSNYSMYESGNRNYPPMEMLIRDPREGKSGQRRKMYMDGKGLKDKSYQMKELESYMQELSQDVTEMIQDASPEEKQLLQQKISMLATKIK